MNLLIVDDDRTSLKLLRNQLESEGHAVFEAHDGVDALALLEHQRVDAVISDVLMPRMDGYRLCHEIRKHARLYDLPIIIYTSTYTSLDDEKLALDVGADKYLKKPVSVETIITALHEVIAILPAARQPKALLEVEVLKEYSGQLVSKLVEKNTELMAAEGKFRALVEQSIVGIYIIQDDQFVYVNPRLAEILGRLEEEITSRTLYDFLVPEDQALARENIRKRISGGMPSVHYALRMLHQSGAVLQVEVHGSRTNYKGPPAVMGMLVDITERKRAEEATRLQSAALHAAADAIVITDRAGVMEWVNPAFTQLTGYTAEETLGKHHRDLVRSGKHAPAFYEELWETILAGRTWHGEIINRRKDGSLYTEDQVVTPILDASGAITHFIAIKEDITERKAAEDRIAYLNRVYAVLSGISTLIVRVHDRDELFREACRIAVEAGGFRMAWMGIIDQHTMKIVPVASVGVDAETLTAFKHRFSTTSTEQLGDTMSGQALRDKKPVVANDSQSDPRVLLGKKHAEQRIRAVVFLPLIVSDEAIGVLALYASEIELFHAEEMKLLTELAGDIAFAIDHIDKQERLNYLAYYDVLTGLANRTLFLERVAQSIRSAVSGGHKLAVALLDLERFKNINDSLGQAAGEELLRQVAQWLT